uniref:Fungal-type protein kinase domain-containing protein n=1 Tax=Moniliophthora roreri TaxID=221103 RepID=A0A0W0FD64_MONRR
MEESQRVWKFVLIDENGEEHHFFGGKVAFKGVGVPASRATRGFLVVDSQGNRRYLKDTWRILSDTIQKEGDVYALLKEHNVPHVPDVIVSGNAIGDWQRTKTHEYVTPTFQDAVLRNHQHYFIVFAQVGTPLKDFKNSFELVQATSHAIEAHKVAYEKAKILHRDISVGNILIMDGGQGLLIDWEFSKPLDSSAPRTLERTGTWQFMSARLLSHKPGEVNHILADDLESFYHVLCWVTLMHGRHELSKEDAENQIARVYDGWNGVKASDVKGGSDKIVDLQKKWMAKQAKLVEGPLRDLVVGLEALLVVRYIEPSEFVNQDVVNAKLKKLDDSTWFLDSFSQALQHEEQLKSQERDPIRAISLPAMGDDDPNNRKRKKTDSELQEEDEDEDEERPSRRPRTSES